MDNIDTKTAELEHIENLITGGTGTEKILKDYPHYSIGEIEKIIERVARFCWLSDDEGKVFGLGTSHDC